MITVRLSAGRAAPGANSGTVRVLPIASGGVGGAGFGEVLGVPVAESRRWWYTSCCRWSKPC